MLSSNLIEESWTLKLSIVYFCTKIQHGEDYQIYIFNENDVIGASHFPCSHRPCNVHRIHTRRTSSKNHGLQCKLVYNTLGLPKPKLDSKHLRASNVEKRKDCDV